MHNFNINDHISVLYVEDQIDIREEFVDILSLFVDEIHVAFNGEDGFKKYQQHLPDIIITDIQMPIMSGLKMIEKIRKVDEEIPIIITSAFNDTGYLLEAISLGIEYYLLKPIMLDQLKSRLNLVIKRLRQKRELEAYQLHLEDRIEEEVALREAKEALLIEQNKSYEIGQMVGVIAHQWKQPLHYLNLLIEDLGIEYAYQPLSPEYIKDFIQKGTNRVKFLSETMDNFLSFYRHETQSKTFSMSKLTQEIYLFLDMSFKSEGINIEIIAHDDFSLHGIENELQQVIFNLVNNAKEALAEQRRDDAKIKIEISKQDDEGLILIHDDAGGIPSADLEYIFDLNFTTKKEGNGIGLYLAKKIVTERFNGSIDVSNNEQGACFTLKFKLCKDTEDV